MPELNRNVATRRLLLDDMDWDILTEIESQPWISNADVARKLARSASTVNERIDKLKSSCLLRSRSVDWRAQSSPFGLHYVTYLWLDLVGLTDGSDSPYSDIEGLARYLKTNFMDQPSAAVFKRRIAIGDVLVAYGHDTDVQVFFSADSEDAARAFLTLLRQQPGITKSQLTVATYPYRK